MSFETVIGLEIHAQLATKTKIFSTASTAFGAAPNTQANLVDLGYPGVLPVLNIEAVRMAAKFGLAIGASVWDERLRIADGIRKSIELRRAHDTADQLARKSQQASRALSIIA